MANFDNIYGGELIIILTNMTNPEKTPPLEVVKTEREQAPTPTLGELASLAEFDAKRFKKVAETATNEKVKTSLQKDAYKKADINRLLQSLVERNMRSVDDVLEKLFGDVRAAETQPSISESVRKEIEAKKSAIEFLATNRNAQLNTHTDFQTWQQEKMTAQAKRMAEQRTARAQTERVVAAPKIEKVYRDIGIESPTEREKSRERAAELVLQDGGVRIHMSVERNLSARGNSGFQDLETRIQDGRSSSSARGSIEGQLLLRDDIMRRKGLDDVLNEHGIKEIIDIRHDTKPVYETVTIPGKKGVLGIGKIPDRTERRATGGYEPILHSEIVSGGKKEPAVRLTYLIPQTEWRDYSGRKGQMMSVEIVLPESIAKEIEQTLDRDPATMRRIVERVLKEKLLKDPKAWETPQGYGDSLRPPYDKWDAEHGGGKIYVQQERAELGFHEESVRKLKK